MNIPVLTAGLVMAVTFLVHVFAGGPELYDPLRASGLSAIERASFSVIWHFCSVQLLLLAVALLYLGRYQNTALFAFVLVTVLGFALLFLGYGLADLGSVWPMPQWVAFAVSAGLMLWGALRA